MIEAIHLNQPLSEAPAAIVAPAPAWVPAGWYFGFDPTAQKAPVAATATIPAYVPESDHIDAPRDPRCTISYIGRDGTTYYYGQIIYNQGGNDSGAPGTKINCPPKPAPYSHASRMLSRIREERELARNQSSHARSYTGR